MGNVLEVSVAVCLEKVIMDKVLRFEICDGDNDSETVVKLALIASALKDCAEKLRIEYVRLEDVAAPNPKRETWNLPDPSVVPSPNNLMPALTFKSKLRQSNDQLAEEGDLSEMRSLFLADYTAHDQPPIEVVVKFTVTYNEHAHKLMAEHGFAPKLYSSVPMIGGRMMVVMERVQGTQMCDLRRRSLPSKLFDDIRKALDILHERNFVFGDLRNTNIMVLDRANDKTRVELVDFDWVGIKGRDAYPACIRRSLIGTELSSGVSPCGLMEPGHDDSALQFLESQYSSGIVQ
jgi:hypothetical protein